MVVGEKPPHAISISQNGFPSLPKTLSIVVRNAIILSMKVKRSERPQTVGLFVSILDGHDSNEETAVVTKPKSSRMYILSAIAFLIVIH